jgi:hypothetical protein
MENARSAAPKYRASGDSMETHEDPSFFGTSTETESSDKRPAPKSIEYVWRSVRTDAFSALSDSVPRRLFLAILMSIPLACFFGTKASEAASCFSSKPAMFARKV